jgi:hypothetical protein
LFKIHLGKRTRVTLAALKNEENAFLPIFDLDSPALQREENEKGSERDPSKTTVKKAGLFYCYILSEETWN